MKAVATGAMGVAAILWLLKIGGPLVVIAAPAISTVFIALTAGVLIADLKRPERFFYILTRSNWRSWMVWGDVVSGGAWRAQLPAGSSPDGSGATMC